MTRGVVGGSITNVTAFAGCVFDGDLASPNVAGTVCGLSGNDAAAAVIDCLDVSECEWPIMNALGRKYVENTFYTADKVNLGAGISGTNAVAVAAKPAAIGAAGTDYGFVKAYAAGLAYGGLYYVLPENAAASSDVTAENGTVVSGDWLEQYYPGQSDSFATVVNAIAANGRKVWECYIADLDPTDPDDDLVAGIDMSGGKVRIYIEKGESPVRYYRIMGRETLNSAPVDVTDQADNLSSTPYRFFHVEVSLER